MAEHREDARIDKPIVRIEPRAPAVGASDGGGDHRSSPSPKRYFIQGITVTGGKE